MMPVRSARRGADDLKFTSGARCMHDDGRSQTVVWSGAIYGELENVRSGHSLCFDGMLDSSTSFRAAPVPLNEVEPYRLISTSARKLCANSSIPWNGRSDRPMRSVADGDPHGISEWPIARVALDAQQWARVADSGKLESAREVKANPVRRKRSREVAQPLSARVAAGSLPVAMRRRYASSGHGVFQASNVPPSHLPQLRPIDTTVAWLARTSLRLRSFATARATRAHRENRIRDIHQARIYCPWPYLPWNYTPPAPATQSSMQIRTRRWRRCYSTRARRVGEGSFLRCGPSNLARGQERARRICERHRSWGPSFGRSQKNGCNHAQ